MFQIFPTVHLELEAPYPPQACAARLQQRVDSEGPIGISWKVLFGRKMVIGRVTPFDLRIRERNNQRRLDISFKAKFVPHGEKTLIVGNFKLGLAHRVFLGFWLGMAAFSLVYALTLMAMSLIAGEGFIAAVVMVAMSSLMLLLGLLGTGNFSPRNTQWQDEVTFLTSFLTMVLDAKVRSDVYDLPGNK